MFGKLPVDVLGKIVMNRGWLHNLRQVVIALGMSLKLLQNMVDSNLEREAASNIQEADMPTEQLLVSYFNTLQAEKDSLHI